MSSAPSRLHVLGAATVGLALVALGACAMVPDSVTQSIASVGSEGTADVSAALAAADNADTSWNPDPDHVVHIPTDDPSGTLVPADGNCNERTYASPAGPGELPAPMTDAEGLDALEQSVVAGDGCIDVVRTSGGPRPGDDLWTFEYYAFALDAVGWSSASTKAPSGLSLAQLRGIYDCTLTDWSQVGGLAGPVQRYWPLPGTGTRTNALELLGFDPVDIATPACPPVEPTREGSGETIAANGDAEAAVMPYSMANWIGQARGTQPDQRAGQVLGSLDGHHLVVHPGGVPSPNTAVVTEANVSSNDPTPAYPGVHYVSHVIDSTHVNYQAVKRFVGFQNVSAGEPEYGVAGPLCNGRRNDVISNHGYVALDRTISERNLQGSTCRLMRP